MIPAISSILTNAIGSSQPIGSSPTTVGASFTDTLKNASLNGFSDIRSAETTAVTGLYGGSSINDVVHNILAAERSLHTMIALRDKIVSAYQEISRMQI